jgi:hypothetical protein
MVPISLRRDSVKTHIQATETELYTQKMPDLNLEPDTGHSQ